MDENIILYDWLSFTWKGDDPRYITHLLGMDHVPWEVIKGFYGYRDALYFDKIKIHYNGHDNMGVCCEMSGQGCRAFEDLSTIQEPDKWKELFARIYDHKMNVTRLDVAYDDHAGLLDIDRIVLDTQLQEYVSRSNTWDIHLSSKGKSVELGSQQSEVLIRIYDKAAERHCESGTHWIRVELQLRRDRAQAFLDLLDSVDGIGSAFCGVVINYLRYVDPDPLDSNRWRWPIKDYWGDFLCNADAIRLYHAPGMEYNLDRAKKYVFGQAGGAASALLDILGKDQFFHELEKVKPTRNAKYDQLVYRYKNLEGISDAAT